MGFTILECTPKRVLITGWCTVNTIITITITIINILQLIILNYNNNNFKQNLQGCFTKLKIDLVYA
jgi:hypothetical protein